MDKFSRQIFSFRGRSHRAEWWLTQLIVSGVLFAILGVVVGGDLLFNPTTLWVFVALSLLGTVIVVLVSIRRLHDRDKSGHWLWLFYLTPTIFGGLGDRLEDQGESVLVYALICQLIAAGLWIWAIVVMGFLRGTSGPNRYGPDPLSSTGEGARQIEI